nr:hormone-sensitive lipase-like [Dermatophagoides farinae]
MKMALNSYLCNFIQSPVGYAFDIEKARIDNDRSISDQLDQVFHTLTVIYADDVELIDYIQRIRHDVDLVLQQAPLFDLDDQTQGNGYWTLLIIMIKFGRILSTPDLKKKIGRLPLIHLMQIMVEGLKVGLQLHTPKLKSMQQIDSNGKVDLSLFTDEMDFEGILDLIQSLKVPMNSLHEHFNFCWLGSMSKVMQLFTNFMAIYSTQWKSFKIYNWLSHKARAQMFTNMVLNVNVDCLQSMWNITEFPLVRIFTPSFWNRFILENINIYAPRQRRWIIDATKPIIHDRRADPNVPYPIMKQSSIRGLLFRYRHNPKNKSLMFHLHGGGFISQSPESHACYLVKWVRKLDDIPILSVDYSLSPQVIFPEALQEILDMYLWILSKDPEVEKTFGFLPEKIVFCGDSAGGNFSMAMMLILNQIQKKIAESEDKQKYRYPNGLFLFYAPLVVATMVSPSRILTSIDGLIPLGTLLNCLGAYLPDEIFEDNLPKEENIDYANGKETVAYQVGGYFINKLKDVLSYLLQLKVVYRIKPWYRRTGNLKKCLDKMNTFVQNPFVSPLLAESVKDFNHIPLYLYPLTFDAFLDDSIEMAKRWQKDKVKVEILDDLPHGFLNFVEFDYKARKASYKCIDRISEILKHIDD